jgi:hypothetical protein
MTPEQIRHAGLDALRRELGVAGMVRFLQQFDGGSGNYSSDRWQWLPRDIDVNSLASVIQESAPEN